MQSRPVAYIRRSSKSRTDPGDTSRDFQTQTVRALAGDDANLVILDGDWGVSASQEATGRRLAFLDLLRSIEAGEVSTLYAYATDRLARSVRWSAQLLDACEAAGTTIVTSEGRFAPGDDMARTLFHFQAVQNENYSRTAKKKRAASVASSRARGVKLGQPYYGSLPGEDLPAVIGAYQRVGSLVGTARELNRLGVQARRTKWGHTTVQSILARAGLVPAHGVRGAKHRAPHIFHRLLRCHCGRTMTGSRRSDGATMYRCIRAEYDVDHGRKTVNEPIILAWAKVEMAKLRVPTAPVLLADVDEERHALTARLDRLRVGFLAGLMDEAAMLAEKADIDGALMQLDLAGRSTALRAFQWTDDAGAPLDPLEVNLALRALWDHVQLGPDLRPLHARWLLPESWHDAGADRAPGSPAAPQG